MLRPADEVLGHGSEARTRLDNEGRAIRFDLIGDPLRHGFIDKEVLPHALAWSHLLAADGTCLSVISVL
jgi:hypothetical protein